MIHPKKLLYLGLILLACYVPASTMYADDEEKTTPAPPYTEEEGSELRKEPFIVGKNVFSSVDTVVNDDASFTAEDLGEEMTVNLIDPAVKMPDQNGTATPARNFTMEITEDDSPEHTVSSNWHTVDYKEFNAIHLAFNIEEGEQVIVYDAQNFYMEIARSDSLELVDYSFNDWVMIPKTNDIMVEVVTNGNGTPPGEVKIDSIGTYSLPNMKTDGFPDIGYEAYNDESQKHLWILNNSSGNDLANFDTIAFMDGLVLEAEKILSEATDKKIIWDGMNWEELEGSFDPEGNPGQEYYPDSTWDGVEPGRSIDALLADLYSSGDKVYKILVNGDYSLASDNFEDVPAVEGDDRRFVLVSDWLKYRLENWLVLNSGLDINMSPHKPATLEDGICTSVYNCPYSPFLQSYKYLAYPWMRAETLDDPDIELPHALNSGVAMFTMDAPSGGATGEAGVPLLTLYNSKTLYEGKDPQNVMILEYHDEDISTFEEETDVQNVAVPIIVNDAGVMYNSYFSLYGRTTSDEITWESSNDIVVEWGDGRVRMFVNGKKVLTSFYSGEITVNHIYVGGVPDYSTFEEFELEAPEPSNISLYVTKQDYDYQLFYGTDSYIYAEDRYPNIMPGIPTEGVLTFDAPVSGNIASFWTDGSEKLEVVAENGVAEIMYREHTLRADYAVTGDTELRWYLHEKTGNTWIGLYVGDTLVIDNASLPVEGTLFGPQYAIQTSAPFRLWQKFIYPDHIAIEEPTYIEGYKVYLGSSREEVESRSVAPKVFFLKQLDNPLDSELKLSGLTNNELYYVGMTAFKGADESLLSNIESFVPSVREDAEPPIPRAAAIYDSKYDLDNSPAVGGAVGSDDGTSGGSGGSRFQNPCASTNPSGCSLDQTSRLMTVAKAHMSNLHIMTASAAEIELNDGDLVETNIFRVSLGEKISFDGALSTDNSDDGISFNQKKYAWSFGTDTNVDMSEKPSHIYLYPGSYIISVEVEDDLGAKALGYSTPVLVNTPSDMLPTTTLSAWQDAGMTIPASQVIAPGETVYFSGVAIDVQGAEGYMSWAYVYDMGDGTVYDNDETAKAASLYLTGDPLVKVPIEHTYSDPGVYTANFTAIDGSLNEGVYQMTIVVQDVYVSHDHISIAADGVPYTISVSGGKAPYIIDGPSSSNTLDQPGQITLNLFEGSYTVTDILGNSKEIVVEKGDNTSVSNVAPTPTITLGSDTGDGSGFIGEAPFNVYPYLAGTLDPDGFISTYEWNFGDSAPWNTKVAMPSVDSPPFLQSNSEVSTGNFLTMGNFPAVLTVQDGNGNTQKQTLLIQVNPNPLYVHELEKEQGARAVLGKTISGSAEIPNNIEIKKTLPSGEAVSLATVEPDIKGSFIYVPKINAANIQGGFRVIGEENTLFIFDSEYNAKVSNVVEQTVEVINGHLVFNGKYNESGYSLALVPDINQPLQVVDEFNYDINPGVYMQLTDAQLQTKDTSTIITDNEGKALMSWDSTNQFQLLADLRLEPVSIVVAKENLFSKSLLGARVYNGEHEIAKIVVIPNAYDGNNIFTNTEEKVAEGWYFDLSDDLKLEPYEGDLYTVQAGDTLQMYINDMQGRQIKLNGSIQISPQLLQKEGHIVGVSTTAYQDVMTFDDADYYLNDNEPIFFGTGIEDEEVILKTPTKEYTITVNDNGSWQQLVPLTEEQTYVEFYRAQELMGSVNVVLDQIPPEVPQITVNEQVRIEGIAEPGTQVGMLLDNAEEPLIADTDENGDFAFYITTLPLPNYATLVAVDRAGNVSDKVIISIKSGETTYTPTFIQRIWSKQSISIIIIMIAFLGLIWVRKQR